MKAFTFVLFLASLVLLAQSTRTRQRDTETGPGDYTWTGTENGTWSGPGNWTYSGTENGTWSGSGPEKRQGDGKYFANNQE